MPSTFTKFLRAAAVSLLCAVGFASPAKAVVITGAWDPVYGAPFDTPPDVLGWRGSATFEIPDICLVPGVVSSATCAGMTLRTAQVVFYDVLGGGTVIETFDYTAAQLDSFAVQVGTGGQILSLTSAYFDPVFPTSTFADINYYGFQLHFVAGGVQMYHSVDLVIHGTDYVIPPNYCYKFIPGFICGVSGTLSDGSTAPGTPVSITFNVVPEPGTIALLMSAGLLGLALQRRRARVRR